MIQVINIKKCFIKIYKQYSYRNHEMVKKMKKTKT